MDIMFGQYANIPTFLHRLHPLTKLFGLIVFIMTAFLFTNLYAYVAEFILLFLFLWLSRMPLRIVLRSLWNIRYLFLLLFLFNILFIRDGQPIWQWGIIGIYPKALLLTSQLMMRLVLLTTYTLVFTLTTNPLDLTTALTHFFAFLGNPAYVFGMILAIALRFIPTLQIEATKIIKAQTARGARFSAGSLLRRAKDLVTLLIPLLVISFSRADTLATAMELRGYDPNVPRTQFRKLSWTKVDTLICWFLAVYALSAIAVKVVL